METVYLETTFFSFYFDDRAAPAIVAMRDWTRQFWDARRADFRFATSAAVLDELRQGEVAHKGAALEFALQIALFPSTTAVGEIVQAYVRNKVMPADPVGDALHLAIASHSECDYLVTWNCRHLANANKFRHIRRINTLLGLKTPELVTPPELLGNHGP